MLGQPASWQTVCRPSRCTSPRSAVNCGPIRAVTLIQGGLRSMGVSALRASMRSMRRPAGWVHRRRLLKSVGFLVLRDRAGLAQVVAAPPALAAFPEETVVLVTGAATVNPAAPGGVEVAGPTIVALTDPAQPPPFDLYRP